MSETNQQINTLMEFWLFRLIIIWFNIEFIDMFMFELISVEWFSDVFLEACWIGGQWYYVVIKLDLV